MTTVYVEAEVNLSEIDKTDLAGELINRCGGIDGAINLIAGSKQERKYGPVSFPMDEDDVEKLRKKVRAAIDLFEAGKKEQAIHDLKMLAAERTNHRDWQAIKEGKHPFLSLARGHDKGDGA